MADGQLLVDLLHLDGAGVLTVRGEIDAASAPVLREAVEHVEALGVPVVCDFAGVTFMAASGLTVLIEASLRTGDAASVCVRNASEQVLRVLEIMGLDSLICAESRLPDVSAAHVSNVRSLGAT